LAWNAGEDWKLNIYLRFDATQDPRDEPYCITACKIFRKPVGTFNSASPERKVGKTCDLAFGYQGGLGAWRKFEPDRFSDQEVEQFKAEWRATHPWIKKFWYCIDIAAWRAVRDRGSVVRYGRIAFLCKGSFLLLKLPSGRKLSYPHPRIEIEDLEHQVVVTKDNSAGQWRDCRHGNGLYGGLLTENIVQARRDLLAEAMLRIGLLAIRSSCTCTMKLSPKCRGLRQHQAPRPPHDACRFGPKDCRSRPEPDGTALSKADRGDPHTSNSG
jgi:DNA polymerase